MKMTLTTYDIANALRGDENARWSRAGSFALAEYLEQLEEETGEEIELDVVAIPFLNPGPTPHPGGGGGATVFFVKKGVFVYLKWA